MLWTSVLVLAAAAWLGIDLVRTATQLQRAEAGFTVVQQRIDEGDLPAAREALASPARQSAAAADRADGPPFRLFQHFPGLAAPVREVRALAGAVDAIGNEVLPGLLASDLRVPTWTGRVDATPFLKAQQPLAGAETQLRAVDGELRAADRSGIGPLTRARADLEAKVAQLAGTVREARVAADIVPALSGQARPQRYFMALQNNAEARATGGLLGAYAILEVDKGRLRLVKVGQNDELTDAEQPVLRLGEEYDLRYAKFETTRTWRSANLSPDVPTVGRLVSALWREQSGQRVDGVVMLDPVGLAQILAATGPVTLSDGSRLGADNAVRVLESEIYARYPTEGQAERYAYLAETTRKAFDALSTRRLDGRAVARQVAKAAATGHLQLWAAEPRVQAAVVRSRIGGRLDAQGPFLSVITNDAGGSKLDFHQRRSVSYTARSTGVAVDLGAGPQLEEQADVAVTLTNAAPSGLPDYVVVRPDDPKAPRGQSHTWVSVYLGARATLLSASLDGIAVPVQSHTEQGLSVYSLFVKIDPGQSRTFRLKVRQPAQPGQPLLFREQPLSHPAKVTVQRDGSPAPVSYVYSRS